mmetsp:Transcript_8787/g.20320  ORF Transcript_8787/g.20320 Transcript_8787/m.20320 type:complete len:221 (+) Transcript_8787:204-866(+)
MRRHVSQCQTETDKFEIAASIHSTIHFRSIAPSSCWRSLIRSPALSYFSLHGMKQSIHMIVVCFTILFHSFIVTLLLIDIGTPFRWYLMHLDSNRFLNTRHVNVKSRRGRLGQSLQNRFAHLSFPTCLAKYLMNILVSTIIGPISHHVGITTQQYTIRDMIKWTSILLGHLTQLVKPIQCIIDDMLRQGGMGEAIHGRMKDLQIGFGPIQSHCLIDLHQT